MMKPYLCIEKEVVVLVLVVWGMYKVSECDDDVQVKCLVPRSVESPQRTLKLKNDGSIFTWLYTQLTCPLLFLYCIYCSSIYI